MQEVSHLHETNELFRSVAGQNILLDAMRYNRLQKAKQNLPSKRYAAPHHVMRPGSGEDRIDADRGERLPETIDGAKAGAKILLNRRARRR